MLLNECYLKLLHSKEIYLPNENMDFNFFGVFFSKKETFKMFQLILLTNLFHQEIDDSSDNF